MFSDNDLGVFFDPGAFGVSVQFSGSSAFGILDKPQSLHLADGGWGGMEMPQPSLQLPYKAFNPMPKARDTITVDSQDYTVNHVEASSDGAIFTLSLKIVP